jgi:hypothetical protein
MKNDEVRIDRVRREPPKPIKRERVARHNPGIHRDQAWFDQAVARLKKQIREIEEVVGACGTYYVVQDLADALAAKDFAQNPSSFVEYEDRSVRNGRKV